MICRIVANCLLLNSYKLCLTLCSYSDKCLSLLFSFLGITPLANSQRELANSHRELAQAGQAVATSITGVAEKHHEGLLAIGKGIAVGIFGLSVFGVIIISGKI